MMVCYNSEITCFLVLVLVFNHSLNLHSANNIILKKNALFGQSSSKVNDLMLSLKAFSVVVAFYFLLFALLSPRAQRSRCVTRAVPGEPHSNVHPVAPRVRSGVPRMFVGSRKPDKSMIMISQRGGSRLVSLSRLSPPHPVELCLPPSPGHRAPPARSGHRCVADNTNLYVFGGYNPDYDESGGSENEDYPLFRELWRYHFATGGWQQIRTEGYMPTELASMSGETLLE